MNKLKFQPTKQWIRDHKYRPESCPDKQCYCIIDHINEHNYGFCVGIKLNNLYDLDIVSFCNRAYNTEDALDETRRYLWHPNEAQLIATYLSYAVINAWGLMPDHRKQLGYLNRQRTKQLNKRSNGNKET